MNIHRQYGKYTRLNTVECNTARICWSAYVRFCNTPASPSSGHRATTLLNKLPPYCCPGRRAYCGGASRPFLPAPPHPPPSGSLLAPPRRARCLPPSLGLVPTAPCRAGGASGHAGWSPRSRPGQGQRRGGRGEDSRKDVEPRSWQGWQGSVSPVGKPPVSGRPGKCTRGPGGGGLGPWSHQVMEQRSSNGAQPQRGQRGNASALGLSLE
jgi:hypothetical protein